MIKPIIVWGGTGQLIVIHEFINDIGFDIVAVIDNDESVNVQLGNTRTYYKKHGLEKFLRTYDGDDLGFIVAIGGEKGRERYEISDMLIGYGLYPVKAIHPKACITSTAIVGVGCQIMASSTIGAKTIVGDYSILNTGSIIDHECQLGLSVHIAPGATLAGMVEIGDYSFIGTGASILPRIKVGSNSIVGAGSVVTKNVPDNVVCYGNPAKIIRGR